MESKCAILSIFDATNIPVVLLDCDIVASPARSKYDVVGVNNGEEGRCLAQHMVDQGVRNVVFLAAPHSDYSIQNRIEGARLARRRRSHGAWSCCRNALASRRTNAVRLAVTMRCR